MSDVDATLRGMKLMDWFDVGLDVLPRRVRQLLLIGLLLLPGGAFVNWYVQEKTAGYTALVTEMMDGLFDTLLPPPEQPPARGPEAV